MGVNQTILKQKIQLTPDQLTSLQQGAGGVLQQQLNQLISDPNYQKLSDEEKTNAINSLVSNQRTVYKNRNAFNITGGTVGQANNSYLDQSGNYKQVDTTPITKPTMTGNSVIDKKLMASYNTAVANQATGLAKSQQPTTISDMNKKYSYVDENGAYKTVDLTPIQPPTLTGDTVVDKKLKSAYYASINAQMNDVIKLGQSGTITQQQMIDMVNSLNDTYTLGKTKKPKKITIAKIKAPKLSTSKFSFKIAKTPKAPKIKIAKAMKIKPIKIAKQRKITLTKLK